MDFLDAMILVALVAAGIGGWRLGFLARMASWVGLAFGLFVAARLLPTAVRAFNGPDPSSRLLVASALLVGGAFVGQGLGLILGAQVHRVLPLGPLRGADRAAGAVVGLLGVLVVTWVLVPPMADVPGWPAEQARASVVAHALEAVAPASPNTVDTLRRLVGSSNFPQVFSGLGRAPQAGPPPPASGLSAAVVARVTASSVKIEGVACHRIQEGSGFTVAIDTVVTNAHVVSGVKEPTVIRPDGRRLRGIVELYDSDRDLAILRVSGLQQTPLPTVTGHRNDQGAVFGHPGGQDVVRAAPSKISDEIRARGRDLYDKHTTERDVWILAADLHPGDSGGALVNTNGQVIGVAFAIAPDRQSTAYALTTKELAAALQEARSSQADTGECLSS
jgi:S1-C subfamily serine protease